MEGIDQEIDQGSMKHVCKFCNKGFPCGRSLGGHMRSHVITSSFTNNGGFTNSNNNKKNSNDSSYELRKDPKKTNKGSRSLNQISSSSSVGVVDKKLCKECGKGFQSWKALFGHMKCHSKKVLGNKSMMKSAALDHHHHHSSWSSQSDNENSDAKIDRIKKRSRSRKRYSHAKVAITTASSSISMNNNNASTSLVSEIDQDQEQEADVAISLMMLSKDLGKWGDQIGSFDHCSSSSVLGKNLLENGCELKKLEKHQVGIDFLGRSEVGFEGFERISRKSDEFTSCFGGINDSNKRKFECVSCNKSFHSYQALGGHKSSHKKLKICFDSKPANENTIGHEPILDHDQTVNGYDRKTSGDHQKPSSSNLGEYGSLSKNVVLGGHECSICLKVFSSGQALGGHKRSHLIAEPKPNQEKYTNVIKKPEEQPICETQRFLDLNMPPQEEEEEEMVMKSCYWEDCSDHHNNESRLLGLLSTSY